MISLTLAYAAVLHAFWMVSGISTGTPRKLSLVHLILIARFKWKQVLKIMEGNGWEGRAGRKDSELAVGNDEHGGIGDGEHEGQAAEATDGGVGIEDGRASGTSGIAQGARPARDGAGGARLIWNLCLNDDVATLRARKVVASPGVELATSTDA
ncbi:uncharacterized protein BXZ73DRAFT_85821, partial [Epithele typhae]|uniref:uncharacterized protein n=1 Tax=Epithele typhae TaxID=378194 RepID=UPI00200748A8